MHNFNCSEVIHLPCLTDREAAIRVLFGLVNEAAAVTRPGYDNVSRLLSTLVWRILPNLDVSNIRLLVPLRVELAKDRRSDSLSDIVGHPL